MTAVYPPPPVAGSLALAASPRSVSLVLDPDDTGDACERKIIRMRLYQCQPGRQFGSEREMDEAVHAYRAELGRLGGLAGAAERPRASVRPS